MFRLRLFRQPAFTGVMVASFAVEAVLVSATNYLGIYCQNGLGYQPLTGGLMFLPLTAVGFVCAPLAARLIGRVPDRWLISGSLALVAIGMAMMSGLTGGSHWTHLIPGFVVAGVGLGAVPLLELARQQAVAQLVDAATPPPPRAARALPDCPCW